MRRGSKEARVGVQYRPRAGERLISVEDYRRAAQRRLPDMIWTYVEGGADDLVTIRDNRMAFDRWALRATVLRGHERPELATTVAGVTLDLPILLSPTGFTGLSHWTGDVAAANAAEKAGTRYVLSTASSWSLEEVAEATNENHFFQLYPTGSEDVVAELMQRAWDAGYRVLFVTVDCPTAGNREGERKRGMGVPPVLTPGRILNASMKPRWTYNFLRHRRVAARSLVAQASIKAAVESIEIQSRNMMATLNWDDIAWMRKRWRGQLFVKGILDPGDAERAVEAGADGIVVSNHGGRQLDYTEASLDALERVVASVGGRTEILLDGGVRRGSDVLKALAIGAQAVMIGRPYIYGLAARGEPGVTGILDIFRKELERNMTLAGIGSVQELDQSWLIPRLGAYPRFAANDPRVQA